MFLTLEDIARACGGEIIAGDAAAYLGGGRPGGLAIDSRDLRPGDWFIALRGKEGRDGHAYLENAVRSGAAGVIVSDRAAYDALVKAVGSQVPALLVPDTTQALADMARALLVKLAPFVIAITGTVGKTSVKESIAHITSTRWPTLRNPHNWNTEIGLPLTVFDLTPEHRVAVLECASRGIGQIHDLSMIARPDLAVITAIGPGHLSEFGSVDTVAAAKWEIVDGLKSDGTVIAPGGSQYTKTYGSKYRLITFGMEKLSDVHAVEVRYGETSTDITIATPRSVFDASIPGTTEGHVLNALCAVAACLEVRIPGDSGTETLTIDDIRTALSALPGIEGRFESIVRASGVEVIFDAYNSNPLSLKNALDAFARRTKLTDGSPVVRRVAIQGDMLELGSEEERYHRDAGHLAGVLPIDCLITVGRLSEHLRKAAEDARGKAIPGAHFPSTESLAGEMRHLVKPGDLVLMKASRLIALEKLLEGGW